MNRLAALVLIAAAGACGGGHHGDDAGDDQPPVDPKVQAASFVRQSFLALDGRRPKSQAEVDAYVDLYLAETDSGGDPKGAVAQAIMARPEFAERWVDPLMDALHVQRVDIQTEASCWDQAARASIDPALAASVRDAAASTGQADHNGKWTMLDLTQSAIALDDLSPIYRAQLFSMVDHPIPAANVDPIPAELARRADFGETFDSAFLHRNIVCLGCHNSERSVTDSDDPAKDRFWPVPGLPEKGIYGDSAGVDEDRAHAAFRVDGFVEEGNFTPWGWADQCGDFAGPNVGTDIANVDAKLASITGKRATVFDLEQSLKRGFDALRGNPPPIGADGSIADPDTALAWLVTLKVTEDVWREATGTNLTIANYFPRNEASEQLLFQLASTFVQSKFSLKALLVAIVESEYFDLPVPEAGGSDGPYTLANVFDPWVISDPDDAKHKNGTGDAVQPVSARALIRATNQALEWGPPPDATRFPDYGEPGCEDLDCGTLNNFCTGGGACCTTNQAVCKDGGVKPSVELPFERGVGLFLRNSERGFAGLDFQARLVWEDRYGACARPDWVDADFIDALGMAGDADTTATAQDLVVALKDRLVGEPTVADGPEHDAIVSVVGDLAGPASAVSTDQLRQVCAALLESPQFLLAGIAGKGGDRPKLTPAGEGYDAVCADLASTTSLGIVCTPGAALTLSGSGSGSGSGKRGAPHHVAAPKPLHRPRGLPPARRPAPLATQGAMRHVPAHEE